MAILETSVLVRAWLSPAAVPNPSRRAMLLTGVEYDSFTSPPILEEVEEVLARPRFGADRAQVRRWLDAFVRASRQVFPEPIPAAATGAAGAARGDIDDLPILHTAYAATAAGREASSVLDAARADGGWFLVSENTKHFTPGWNVYGWQFTTANVFVHHLLRRGARTPSGT
ncbi:MAG: PIN domain-containing protein, partial [Chloroflexota bacterium]